MPPFNPVSPLPAPVRHPGTAWLQLLRLPNLFTVPGDILAGFAIATQGFSGDGPVARSLVPTVLASLALYAAGLLLNDWFDREEDARERPDRPIPAGEVPAGQVLVAGLGLLLLGIGLATLANPHAGLMAVAIALLVLLYNGVARRVKGLGPVVMGLCRAANLALGAAAVGFGPAATHPWLIAAMVTMLIYILVVSLIAIDETRKVPGVPVLLALGAMPLLVLLSGARGLAGEACVGSWLAAALYGLWTWGIMMTLWRLPDPRGIPPLIGGLIRSLIFMQTFWVASTNASCFWVTGVLLLWVGARLCGRWFYGS